MATVLRTPDSRFENLPEYDFRPHYLHIADRKFGSLRMHYLDEGPQDAAVVLLLHGQGCWAYSYRKMIPLLVSRGYRAVAPDYIGFGRSDKLPSTEDYSFQCHVDWLLQFLHAMRLRQVTAYLFDWGGFFGLRIAADSPQLFDRLILSNTTLPTGQGAGIDWFLKWRERQLALPEFPQGTMVNDGVVNKLSAAVVAAYDAPYPHEGYKTGPRRFPMILPVEPLDPVAVANAAAWTRLGAWQKPVLTVFSASLAGSGMGPEKLKAHLPGARGQAHAVLADASFYLMEDKWAELAERIAAFAGPRRQLGGS